MDKNEKRKWTIIGVAAAVVVAIIIGCTVVIVGAINHNGEHQATQQVMGTKTPGGHGENGKQGDEDSAWTKIPNKVEAAADGVVNNLVTGWTKSNDKVEKISPDGLVKTGMSRQCAEHYTWIWDEVFAPAHNGAPMISGSSSTQQASIENVTGGKGRHIYTLTVRAAVHAYYWDKNDQTVTFDPETDVWTVTVDEASGKVTNVVNPTVDQLSFKVPADLTNEEQQ